MYLLALLLGIDMDLMLVELREGKLPLSLSMMLALLLASRSLYREIGAAASAPSTFASPVSGATAGYGSYSDAGAAYATVFAYATGSG